MKRESGYYWVRITELWTIGFYDPIYGMWTICGMATPYPESKLLEVGDHRIFRYA